MIIDQQNVVGIFLMKYVLHQQSFHQTKYQSITFLKHLFFRLFYLSARFFSLSFLTLKSSFIIYLPYFHTSDCFFYFHGCWECWLPRISGYHVPHTSGVATKGTIFKERIFSVSNKLSPILVIRFLGNDSKNV